MLQAPAEGLNEEELVGSGVKVDTLKKLLPSTPGEEQGEGEGEETKESGPPKLISLDQITVKGEDLTGVWNNILVCCSWKYMPCVVRT